MYNDNDEGRDRKYFSAPDENGIRYYQSQSDSGVTVKKAVKNHSLRNSLIIFACIMFGLIVLGASCANIIDSGDGEIKLPTDRYIATVYVKGTIGEGNYDTWGNAYGYQHNWTLNEIDRLMNDSNNKAMIIYVDSPGGGVYESDELYCKIKEYQQSTGRPVYAAMAGMAASGGYYISAPADKIYANRNCWTGSIGVTIGTIVDISGFLEHYGIKTTTITSGRNKAMGSYFDPLTTEQKNIFQSLVDEAYDQFTSIVADERGMKIETVREIADGRIYTAKQALALGLIDVIGTYSDAEADLRKAYNLYDCGNVDIIYTHTSLLSNILGNVNLEKIGAKGDAAAILDLLEKRNRFPVSYFYEI